MSEVRSLVCEMKRKLPAPAGAGENPSRYCREHWLRQGVVGKLCVKHLSTQCPILYLFKQLHAVSTAFVEG